MLMTAVAVATDNVKGAAVQGSQGKYEKVVGPNKQDSAHPQLPFKQIDSDSKRADNDMYKTMKNLKVPSTVLEEEDSINSHNAKSVDLSEHGPSSEKVCSVQ